MEPPERSSPEWNAFIEMCRAMTPDERLQRSLELTEQARLQLESDLRRAHPHASEREIFLRAGKHRLGDDLFYRVYGNELERITAGHQTT
jgi:hypothetical protein